MMHPGARILLTLCWHCRPGLSLLSTTTRRHWRGTKCVHCGTIEQRRKSDKQSPWYRTAVTIPSTPKRCHALSLVQGDCQGTSRAAGPLETEVCQCHPI